VTEAQQLTALEDGTGAPGPGAVSVSVPDAGDVRQGLAEAWCAVLEMEEIEDGSNFFELGGHSMLAAMLISQCERVVGTLVPLQIIFEHPVFADFVEAVVRYDGTDGPALARIVSRGLDRAPLSRQQQDYLDFERKLRLPWVNNMVAVVEVGAPLSLGTLRSALGAVVRRHPALRTALRTEDGMDTQVLLPLDRVPDVPCAEVDLSALPARQRPAVLRTAVRREHMVPFDVDAGAMVRCQVFRNGEDPDVLVLHLYHAACDGNCVGLIFDDLAAACAGRELSAPDPGEPGYLDYCQWQHENLTEIMDSSGEHWRRLVRELAQDMDESDVPAPRPGASYVRLNAQLPGADTHHLRTWVAAEGLTEFSSVSAAAALAVGATFGKSKAGIGMLLDTRGSTGLEHTIGSYALSSLMSVDLADAGTPRGFIARVQESHLEARRWTQLPLEDLVAGPADELGVDPSALVDVVVDFERIYRMNRPGRLPLSVGLDLNELLRMPLAGPRRAMTAFVHDDGRLTLAIECVDDPAERALAEALLSATVGFLASFASGPDTVLDPMPRGAR
jgi:Condensation domain/Phosphopantetheine attachment site